MSTPTIDGVGTETEVKAALRSIADELGEFAEKGIKLDNGDVTVSEEDAREAKRLMNKYSEVKQWVQMYEVIREGKSVNQTDHEPKQPSVAVSTAVKSLLSAGFNTNSISEAFVNSTEFKDMKASHANSSAPFNVEAFDIYNLGRKDVYSDMQAHNISRGFGPIQFDPIVPRAHRRLRVRDLFPAATTQASLIDFYQVLGFVENNSGTGLNSTVSGGSGNAQTVPDYVTGSPGNFGLKPKSNLQFRDAQAPVRTIAHWEAVHRNALDDEPQLQAIVNNELLYGLSLAEDVQILKGQGTGTDLLGIMNTQYLQTYSAPALELRSDSLRRAATLSIIAGYPSTGYVLHPNDWEGIELQRAVGGDEQYMLMTNISVGLQAQVWRQPVVDTPAIDEGTFLTGAFGTGAQLYDRQQANVRVSDQHADYFIRNALAVLCEERLALVVRRPESFIKGKFQGVTSFPADEDANSGT